MEIEKDECGIPLRQQKNAEEARHKRCGET